MERIKAVFNWSGGKDSAHALLRAMQSGKYEIVALLTTVNRDTHRSTMHGIPTALLQAQAPVVEGRHHRLARAGGGDNQVAPAAVVALKLQLVEHFLLVGFGREIEKRRAGQDIAA